MGFDYGGTVDVEIQELRATRESQNHSSIIKEHLQRNSDKIKSPYGPIPKDGKKDGRRTYEKISYLGN